MSLYYLPDYYKHSIPRKFLKIDEKYLLYCNTNCLEGEESEVVLSHIESADYPQDYITFIFKDPLNRENKTKYLSSYNYENFWALRYII